MIPSRPARKTDSEIQVSVQSLLPATRPVRTSLLGSDRRAFDSTVLAASASRQITESPDWLNTQVTQWSATRDLKFGWKVVVSGFQRSCTSLLWEQWTQGGFTLEFDDGTEKTYNPASQLRSKNPQARIAQGGNGQSWVTDILPGWRSGPRPVGRYRHARCVLPQSVDGGVAVDGGSSGPTVDANGRYEFRDAPGMPNDIGDRIGAKTCIAIRWHAQFAHKLWWPRPNQGRPFLTVHIQLAGRYDSVNDSRRLTSASQTS